MGRIRTIKPGFFKSKSLARCTFAARIHFAGLWGEADDLGRGVAEARILKGSIWPLEDQITPATVEAMMAELVETGHIDVYTVNGDDFYRILNWEKHQSAAYRRGESQHPAPPPHDPSCKKVQPAPTDVQESAGVEGTRQDTPTELPASEVPVDKPGQSSSLISLTDLAHNAAKALWAENQSSDRPVSASKERAWLAGTTKNILAERQADLLRAQQAGLTLNAATEMLTSTPAKSEAWHANPHCTKCPGDGFVTLDDGTLGACSCRGSTPWLASVYQLPGAASQ